ncbi:MAG: hypothetical protein KAH03_01370 [Cocleimonas sp.]|nr:hypothetical protein [Cocleimonas sp.]
MYEQAILHKASEQFEDITGFQVSLDFLSNDDKGSTLLRLEKKGESQQFIVEVKHNLTPSTASFSDREHDSPLLFVTNYVNCQLSKKLKKQNINFIDTVGNAYIDVDSLFIYISGRKPKKNRVNKTISLYEQGEILEKYYNVMLPSEVHISVTTNIMDVEETYKPFSTLLTEHESAWNETVAGLLTYATPKNESVWSETLACILTYATSENESTWNKYAVSGHESVACILTYAISGSGHEPAWNKTISTISELNQVLADAYKPDAPLAKSESIDNINAISTLSNLNKTLEGGTYKPITSISQLNKRKIEKLTRLTPSKLKLLFVFLCEDDSLNKTYRKIQKISGVSTGTITKVMNELEEKGYLTRENKRRKIQNKKSLIRQWVSAYDEKLRPKLIMGYYKAVHKNWYEKVDLQDFNACWSGEVAADKLTNYLTPHFSTLYIDGQPNKLILLNGLKASGENEADIEILGKFWHFENKENPFLAPALLIYADLINSSEPRNIEVAKQVYDEFID